MKTNAHQDTKNPSWITDDQTPSIQPSKGSADGALQTQEDPFSVLLLVKEELSRRSMPAEAEQPSALDAAHGPGVLHSTFSIPDSKNSALCTLPASPAPAITDTKPGGAL